MNAFVRLPQTTKIAVGGGAGAAILGFGWWANTRPYGGHQHMAQLPDKPLSADSVDGAQELGEVYRGGQVGGSKQACEDAFDRWVSCLVHSECFKSKGPNAGHPELKACAKSGAAGVEEECVNMLSFVRLCRRSQVDMRKRFVGKPN